MGIRTTMPTSESALNKVVVLLGPTASGKTDWSLRLAKEFNAEIVSADSRQIYQKMDIGTAKELGEWRWDGVRKFYVVHDVPHYLVDFLDPGQSFTVAEFRDKSFEHIADIHSRGKVAFVVGGTGLYIQSLVDNYQIPRIAPNKKLRQSLEGKQHAQLLQLLKRLDPAAAKTIDTFNKRRMVRALEVCILSGRPFSEQYGKGEPLFQFLQIGVEVPRDVLYARIEQRVDGMIERGLVKEIEKLRRQKYAWELPSMSGVGYRQFRPHVDDHADLKTAVEHLKRDTRHYARRQLAWFRRDLRIQWIAQYDGAREKIKTFLSL